MNLNDGEGNDKTVWTFPDGLSRFCLIIVGDSTTRLIAELPPLSFGAWRQTKKTRPVRKTSVIFEIVTITHTNVPAGGSQLT